MNTRQSFILVSAALALGSATSRGLAPSQPPAPEPNVAYTITQTEPASVLVKAYLYYGISGGTNVGYVRPVTFDNVNSDGGVPHLFILPNTYGFPAVSFGEFGVYGISSGETVTNQSVFVAFNSLTPVPAGTSFDTFFAPFFQEYAANFQTQYGDPPPTESSIVAALTNPSAGNNSDILYNFTQYLQYLGNSNPATAAAIDTGSLTLYHFSDATAFGVSTAVSVVPEPSTWAAVLAGTGFLGLVLRRRACTR